MTSGFPYWLLNKNMKEQLYKRKAQLLEMLIQIQNELGSVNQELVKLETPVESPKPEEPTS